MSPKRPATIRAGIAAAAEKPLAQLSERLPHVAGPAPFDPIHDARVALRRLAVLLRSFAPYMPPARVANLKREIRWLRRELGPARDLDVFIHETIPELHTLFRHEDGLDALLETAKDKRRQAGAKLAKTATSERAQRLIAALRAAASLDGPPRRRARNGDASLPETTDAPFAKFVRATLRRRWKKIRKVRRPSKLAKPLLHEQRIRLRNFRYLCDGFVIVLPARRYAMFRRAMTALQDHLGSLNDASVAPVLAAGLARQAVNSHDRAAVARASGLFAGWGAARRQVFHATLDEPWHHMVKRGDRMFAAMRD